MHRTRLVVATVLVLSAQACVDSQHGDLQIDLAMRSQIATHEAVIAAVTITNTSDRSIRLLSWYLPDADLQEPLFQVTRDGQPVRYTGPRYKRAQPDASDFITLMPGATLNRSVDLARFYDVSATG